MKNRSFSNVSSAKRALRKAGLSAMLVTFESEPVNALGRERIVPVIQCAVSEDISEVRRHGFKTANAQGKKGA
jgi:hypothetical protein